MKKAMTRLMALVVCMCMFSSCSQPTTPTPDNTQTSSSDESATPAISEEELLKNPELYFETYYKKSDPAISLTQNVVGAEDQTRFFPGDTWSSNQFTEWAESEIGIQWSAKWPAPDDETGRQKLTLAIATDDLPDVIQTDQVTLKKLVEAGQVLPLTDLWEKHASPLTKAIWDETQEVMDGMAFSALTFDGELYAIPSSNDAFAGSGLWYRTDLLKKYNLDFPKTIEEFENLLKKYKEENPNGVGVYTDKDLTGLEPIFAAFGAYKGIWLEDEKGVLEMGSVQPEMRNALETLSRWYKLGYLDKEFMTKDLYKAYESMAAGNMLTLGANWAAVWNPLPSLAQNVPESRIEMGPFLKTDGHEGGTIEPSPVGSNGWAISSKCKNPEAIFYQYNLQFDSCYRNDEELRERFPFKYDVEPTKAPLNKEEASEKGPVYEKRDYKNPGPGNGSSYFWNRGNNAIAYGFAYGQRIGELAKMLTSVRDMTISGTTGENEIEKGWSNDSQAWFGGFDHLKIAAGNAAEFISNSSKNGTSKMTRYFGAPTDTMNEKNSYLTKAELETFMKIIVGELPIEAFDNFVKDWKSNGGDTITQEVNDWYQNNK